MKQLFKSDLTGKVYDSEEECLKAEKEHNELVVKQNKEKEERKEAATTIKTAYEDYLNLRTENKKKEQEAYKKYLDLRDDFIDKYGSYHLTVSTKDNSKPKVDFGFDDFNKMINSFFDTFWINW